MINVAIVDDEKPVADTLAGYVRQYGIENGLDIKAQWFSSAVSFIEKYDHKIDVVFMDIEMPHLDGMNAVKRLREMDETVVVIFVTNLARYAVKGYEVNAFDFIVKPVSYSSFVLKFRRALKKIDLSKDSEIWISSRRGKKLIKSGELMYIEVMKHVIIYHAVSGDFTGSGTLKQVAEKLPPSLFVLCNKCYLVNLKFVTEIKDYVAVVGGNELQISAAKRKTFINALNNYLGGTAGRNGGN